MRQSEQAVKDEGRMIERRKFDWVRQRQNVSANEIYSFINI